MDKNTLAHFKRDRGALERVLLHYSRGGELKIWFENRKTNVPCPFHVDNNPSLSIYQNEGIRRWKCHRCEIGGTLIDVVRHGSPGCTSFSDWLEELELILKPSTLVCDEFLFEGEEAKSECISEEGICHPPFLGAGETEKAVRYNDRLLNSSDNIQTLADTFGLSPEIIRLHASDEGRGMLGISPAGEAVYLYTFIISEAEQELLGIKIRTGKKPHRFYFECGKPFLWGYHTLLDKEKVILTESESDLLSIDDALLGWDEEKYGERPGLAAVPGSGNFNPAWAPMFQGKRVVIAFDGDEAGLNGAEKLRTVLSPYALSVTPWNLPDGIKDAREFMINKGRQEMLSLLINTLKTSY